MNPGVSGDRSTHDPSPGDGHPLVEIHWLDAIEITEWKDHTENVHALAPSWSVGYLLRDDDTAITVASLRNDNHWSLGITIPKGMVKEVRYLQPKKGK